ncbi:transposase, partial [Phocaeicola sp. RTP21359st1_C8_RTP21359_211015]|uniref:IS66 family transposase n=1 Tax=Phocaeicola sp. RTP21359st1_C8_RTP21359_211015 TaxID=3143193 RepID=UPI0034A5570A
MPCRDSNLSRICIMWNNMADKQELPYEGRAELRQRLSKPMLDSFELWLKNTYPKVLKRSLMGKAIAYA